MIWLFLVAALWLLLALLLGLGWTLAKLSEYMEAHAATPRGPWEDNPCALADARRGQQ